MNFCNLNYNLKKAIIKRGLLDSNRDDKNGLFNELDEQKEEENINEDIKNIIGNDLS